MVFFGLSGTATLHLSFMLSDLHHILEVLDTLFQNMGYIWVLLASSRSLWKVVKYCLILSLQLQMLVVISHIDSLRLRQINLLVSLGLYFLCISLRLRILPRWGLVHHLVGKLLTCCAQKVWIGLHLLSLSRCCSCWLLLLSLLIWFFGCNLLLLLSWIFSLLVDHELLLLVYVIGILYRGRSFRVRRVAVIYIYY